MQIKQKYYMLLLFSLVLFFGVSYFIFTKYQPKAVRQISEVKGYKTSDANSLNLPYPQDAQQAAVSNTMDSEQVTFHSSKTKEEMLNFYKNVLLSKGWDLDSEGVYNDFSISRYTYKTNKITIITFDEPDTKSTLTSIEILRDQ